ncbi:hypothetical protein CLV63_12423 [Murinocardiopsis flavida]|uniref:DUF742 family protein n=1 Tax=Murinocardiopsis flavida TaxID=645275 RepID=A0A2P8CY72_9ACTN|nr:hypothetical protein [Murinocardiopsis flavida]PSK89919.1 hypothetical protein CLV63_12423 [Murinocardiopsis flavida]
MNDLDLDLPKRTPGLHLRRAPGDDCPRILVVDHSMVWVRRPAAPRPDLSDWHGALYDTCRAAGEPIIAMDLVIRTAMPRGVVRPLISDLVRAQLLDMGPAHPSRDTLGRVLRELENL